MAVIAFRYWRIASLIFMIPALALVRVVLLVSRLDVQRHHPGIHGRAFQTDMAQQLLDSPDISALLHHMRSAGMA